MPLPATWGYPAGSGDVSARGFAGSIRQARGTTGLTATIARGNAHLRDALDDPDLGAPYENLVVDAENPDIGFSWPGSMPVEPGGSFTLDGVINFSAGQADGLAFSEGNFTAENGYPDREYPGLPGEETYFSSVYTNSSNFSVEFLGYMHLPAGQTTLRVRSDDAMQLAFHPNDARDIFREQVLGYDTNDGAQNRAVTVDVAQEGVYAFRLLQAQWNLDAGLELYTDSPGGPVPVNGAAAADLAATAVTAGAGDVELSWTLGGTLEESPDLLTPFAVSGNQGNPQRRSTASAARGFFRVRAPQVLPVYRGLTVPTRPYVSGIAPSDNESGVDPAAAIVVTMENRGTANVTMTVEGSTVVPVITEAGSTSTLTYTPPAPFAGGQEVNVGLTYGNAEASWSYVIETGSKALMFGARGASGDDWVAARLASQFGLDVEVVDSTSISPLDAYDKAEAASLVYISSSVLATNANSVAVFTEIAGLAVPMVCVEQACIDELGLREGAAGTTVAGGRFDTIVIVDDTHPTAGGLPAGARVVLSASGEQHHWAEAPANAALVGELPDFGTNIGNDVHWVVDGGVLVNGVETPERRAFFGFVGNNGAAVLNPDGVALWDALMTWLLGN